MPAIRAKTADRYTPCMLKARDGSRGVFAVQGGGGGKAESITESSMPTESDSVCKHVWTECAFA